MSEFSTDPLATQLRSLAPTVDMEASRRLFDSERTEQRDPRRWLLPAAVIALLVGGVVGVWALARDNDGVVPADSVEQPDPSADSFESFEMLAVEATAVPFGTIRAAQSDDELAAWWAEDLPDTDRPVVDFDRSFVAAFTVPDDACPDIFVGFRDDFVTDGVVWEPEFEPPPGGCDQPLINRTYVMRIARPPEAMRITLRLPANDVYDYAANELPVDVAPTTAEAAVEPDLGEIEPAPESEPILTTSLPSIGSAQSVMTLHGPIWIVRHDDGSVSAVAGVVRMPPDEDTGVTGLGQLVAWDSSSRTFAGRWLHDEYGRAVNGPRSDDLVGFDAHIDGNRAAVLSFDRERIPGDPLDVPLEGDHRLLPLDLGEPLELDVLPTLSSRFAGWRLWDASLVVEQGVGILCVVDREAPVPALSTCDGLSVETQVTSTKSDITSWFFGPVLAETDEFGEIITVAPLGGQASRNDGQPSEVRLDEIEVVIDSVVSECNPTNPGAVTVTLLPGWTVDVVVEVVAGSASLGSTQVSLQDGQVTDVRVAVTDRTGNGQVVIVRSAVDPTIEYATAPVNACT